MANFLTIKQKIKILRVKCVKFFLQLFWGRILIFSFLVKKNKIKLEIKKIDDFHIELCVNYPYFGNFTLNFGNFK